MLKNTVSIGLWVASGQSGQPVVNPKQPRFSMAKTKEMMDRFFDQHQEVRKLCKENEEIYPRMHQSVRNTAWELIMHYIHKWGGPTARNYEIRITYSYLRQALNNSCCVATLKNHVNKLLRMYKGFFKSKYRGGLGLPNQNIACIVLVIDPQVLQFENERDNEAVRMGILSAEQSRWKKAETAQKQRSTARNILTGLANLENRAAKGQATPTPLSDFLKAALDAIPKQE